MRYSPALGPVAWEIITSYQKKGVGIPWKKTILEARRKLHNCTRAAILTTQWQGRDETWVTSHQDVSETLAVTAPGKRPSPRGCRRPNCVITGNAVTGYFSFYSAEKFLKRMINPTKRVIIIFSTWQTRKMRYGNSNWHMQSASCYN